MHSKDELKTEICLANRIRILDTRMDEWMPAFLIHCHDIECFCQTTSVFCFTHRCDTWHFESQGGQFASLYCSAIPLSVNAAAQMDNNDTMTLYVVC